MSQTQIPTITVNADFVSIFSDTVFPQHNRGGMILTDRVEAQNLRLRESEAGYHTDWHVAGDPTLIIIQQGTLRLTLRDGKYRDFMAGEAFIAEDYLPDHITFDAEKHGHQAAVIGDERLKAVHVKLAVR